MASGVCACVCRRTDIWISLRTRDKLWRGENFPRVISVQDSKTFSKFAAFAWTIRGYSLSHRLYRVFEREDAFTIAKPAELFLNRSLKPLTPLLFPCDILCITLSCHVIYRWLRTQSGDRPQWNLTHLVSRSPRNWEIMFGVSKTLFLQNGIQRLERVGQLNNLARSI